MKIVMRYCKKCVQTDTRPGIVFDSSGICAACNYSDSLDKINWEQRRKQIIEIAEWAKKKTTCAYDCVIGVSGGKDSTFQALYARDKLGLNPLLVNAVPEGITQIGAHNVDNLSRLGFDMFMIRPNPNIMRQLIKRDFFKYCNPQKVTEYSLWSSAYQIALAFKIPLIIQGENPGLTAGALKGIGNSDDAVNICYNNTLSGGDAIEEYGKEIDPQYLSLYQFPDVKEFEAVGIKAIFLQYYIREWSWRHNGEFAIAHGLQTRSGKDPYELGRYTLFSSLDSDMNIYNQMLKYYKLGFGGATDDACYDIRDGRISREEGIDLVKKYDGKCGNQYIKEFCNYIGICEDEFWGVVNKFVNKKLFKKDPDSERWTPKFEVGVDYFEE